MSDRIKHSLLSFILLLSLATTSIVPLTSTRLPNNCLKVDSMNKCTICENNYLVLNGACALKQVVGNAKSTLNIKPPCGQKLSCGEALSFQNQLDLRAFLARNTINITKNKPTQNSILTNLKGNNKVGSGLISSSNKNSSPVDFAVSIDSQLTSLPETEKSPISPISPNPTPHPEIDPTKQFSGTNNQRPGVDQADILKTDGTYIYTLSNQVLSIILAYPYDRSRVLSETSLKDFRPHAIFVEGDVLAVFGVKSTYVQNNVDLSNFGEGNLQLPSLSLKSETHIRIYNISNRVYPFLASQYKISGSYLDGRKLDNGYMYLVTSQASVSEQTLPWHDIGGGKISSDHQQIFYYYIASYKKPQFVNIISFNLKNPSSDTFKMISIYSQSGTKIYMSEYYLYLASPYNENETDYTKFIKIYVYDDYIQPFASGNVIGSVLNQFMMDQDGDYLRVVTTVKGLNETYSRLTVLDFHLRKYAVLNGIAEGQSLKSARFYGNRLYISTSAVNNPFIIINLRFPRIPYILGEFKMSGFSSYLHLYDEFTLIGLGQQLNSNGQSLGLKISLFNVTDPRYPRETTTFTLDNLYANSIALTEHKAVLFERSKNLLVIPSYLQSGSLSFNGAFIFSISSRKIELKAVANHVLSSQDDFSRRYVERSLHIQDILYTKSKCLMKLNRLGGLYEGVRNINIPCVAKAEIEVTQLTLESDLTGDGPN